MDHRDKILALAKNAPLLPSIVAKELQTNSIIAGAMLSEMVAKGMLKTSALRVGGSPLYLIPGNEAQLLNHLNSLNEKDRRTVVRLEVEKVMRENEVDPLTRVSLSHVRDFAKPLIVVYEDKQETFYKWFALGDPEAEEFIKSKLEPPKTQEIVSPAPIEVPEQKKTESIQTVLAAPEKIPSAVISSLSEQSPPVEARNERTEKKESPSGQFWDRANAFFGQNNISLIDQSVIKKKTEFDLVVTLPSPVGNLTYYCKARSKKKITDADISAAYVQGQIRKLPALFITDGELTKQAKVVLAELKGLTVKVV